MNQIKCKICKENNEIIEQDDDYKYYCTKCKYTIVDEDMDILIERIEKFKKLF